MIIGIVIFLIVALIVVMLFNKNSTKSITIVFSVIILFIASGLYFLYYFLSALAPPKVTVTKDYISTNQGFINGVTIEKIRVDSIGDKDYPIKYTVLYTTSCNIKHPVQKPPDPPNRIEFSKPGKYSWDQDTIKVRYVHKGLTRLPLDTTNRLWWLNKFGRLPVCPLKFEKEQWYFITLGNPQVTGIFFYIDKNGQERQFYLKSGVSPI